MNNPKKDPLSELLDGVACPGCGAPDVSGHTVDVNLLSGQWVILCPKKKRARR